ncbi:MAG TPA: hypothetical protein VNK04_02935 [Gemmataceae bacterium]|nr:hypothetical protein [Gemmataceae bacterium]
MRPEELTELLRVHPFVPLRIHLTDGQSYEIHHPDQVLVLRGRVDIGIGADPVTGVLERVEHCSLLHIVRVEEIRTAVPPGDGAANAS